MCSFAGFDGRGFFDFGIEEEGERKRRDLGIELEPTSVDI
jgi:hypothetical protein